MEDKVMCKDSGARLDHSRSQADPGQPMAKSVSYSTNMTSDTGSSPVSITVTLDERIQYLLNRGHEASMAGNRLIREANDLLALRNALPTRMDPAAERAMRELLNNRY